MSTPVLDLAAKKDALRRTALDRRKAAHTRNECGDAARTLVDHVVKTLPEGIVAGYMPIQTEIDPRSAMMALEERGYRLCVPVIQGRAMPLIFREWTSQSDLIEGDYGAMIPRGGETLIPDVAIVPLLGFDRTGNRLGYGGGFYDRSLAELRANKPVWAVGLAYEAQCLDAIPTDSTDHALNAAVTETGLRIF